MLGSLLALMVGCTGSPAQPIAGQSSHPRSTGGVAGNPAPTPAISPQIMERLVLTADLSDPASAWRRVAFIPFGKGPSLLGFRSFQEGGPSSQPSAFAVAPDGTIWIDDRWKSRVAHYSRTGRFLGQIRGLADRGYDIAFSHGVLYALAYPGGRRRGGSVAVADPATGLTVTPVVDEGRGVIIDWLFPMSEGVATVANGYWDSSVPGGEGPRGFVQLDVPGSGRPRSIPGLPVGPDSWFRLQAFASPGGGEQDFDFTFVSASATEVQPVHIAVRAHGGDSGKLIPAEVGIVNQLSVGRDVAMYVMLTPARRADAARYGGGRWLLRIGRSPVLWERLPQPGIPDELERRHLAAGADGSLYLMVVQKQGVQIFRRP